MSLESMELSSDSSFIVLTGISVIGTALTTAVTYLYKKSVAMQENQLSSMQQKLAKCESEHATSISRMINLTGRVHHLEGVMIGHQQSREDMKDGLKELSKTVQHTFLKRQDDRPEE